MNIKERLQSLPNKVSDPLRRLNKLGQISDSDIELLLDASDLSGVRSIELLGFAIEALGPVQNEHGLHNPIPSALELAKRLRLKISLSWSWERWEQFVDRSLKLQALRTASKHNVNYDVCSFERLLPSDFPGYIIRSRLRLAAICLWLDIPWGAADANMQEGNSCYVCLFHENGRILVLAEKPRRWNDSLRFYLQSGHREMREFVRCTLETNLWQNNLRLQNQRKLLNALEMNGVKAVRFSLAEDYEAGLFSFKKEPIIRINPHRDLSGVQVHLHQLERDSYYGGGITATPLDATLHKMVADLIADYKAHQPAPAPGQVGRDFHGRIDVPSRSAFLWRSDRNPGRRRITRKITKEEKFELV